MNKVLVTDPISEEGKKILLESSIEVIDGSDKNLEDVDLTQINGWIIRSGTTITSDLIKKATNLKVIGRAGVGVDNIDINAATLNGVLVMNTPDANTISAAEHTIALLLSLSRNVHEGYHAMVHGRWDRHKFIGSELQNKSIGIVGLGKIGTEVIKRLHAFDMKILGYDPYVKKGSYELDYVEIIEELDELCKESDYISIHIPRTKKTTGLFNIEKFKLMKPSARIINCSRGGIIDEDDLFEALENNIIGGAALDVFNEEPVKDIPLLKAKNILYTPHLGASTQEAKQGVSTTICESIRDYLNEQKIGSAINIPITDMSILKSLEPHLNLAEKLGIFMQQLANPPIDTMSISTGGSLKDVNIITLAFLKGFFKNIHDENVNYINASAVAEKAGILFDETYSHKKINYDNEISVTINNTITIKGSLFDGSLPRIVQIDGFDLDLVPDGKFILMYNRDVPGVIGKVGSLLGKLNINIDGYYNSTNKNTENKSAIGLVKIHSNPNQSILDQIIAFEEVISAHIISLD